MLSTGPVSASYPFRSRLVYRKQERNIAFSVLAYIVVAKDTNYEDEVTMALNWFMLFSDYKN